MSIRNTAIVSLIAVALYNILFFHTQLGIGTPLLFLGLHLYFFFTKDPVKKNLNLALLSSLISILFAGLFSFRSNGLVQILDLGIASFFSLVSLYLYKYAGEINLQILELLFIPVIAIEGFIAGILRFFKQDSWSQDKENDTTSSIIKGFVVAIPILTILFFLLVKADPIFEKLTQNLLNNIGERTVVSLVLFIILMGFGLAKILEKFITPKELNIGNGKAHELSVILGSISLLFVAFIIIQFRYLFSSINESDLHQLGIASLTYSEYVRKGFFELLIASTIASLVIIYTFKYLHNFTNTKLIVQIFSGILTIETGLLLLSALKRVLLYADAHGLTRARVFGFIFLIWLSILLIIFFIRIFKEMKKEWFFASVVIVSLLAFLSVNIVNIDGLIANKYKPTVNDEIDYFYLASLSEDAIDSWKDGVEDSARIINQLEGVANFSTEDNRKLYWTRVTLDQLYYKVGGLIDKYGTMNQIKDWHKNDQDDYTNILRQAKNESDFPENLKIQRKWQSLNISGYNAYREVIDNIEAFQQIPLLLKKVAILDSKVSDEVRRNTPLDRSTQPPLLR